jgi:hypothetical protein
VINTVVALVPVVVFLAALSLMDPFQLVRRSAIASGDRLRRCCGRRLAGDE